MNHRPVSNSRASVRMFESNLLEALSKVPFYVPLVVFLPVFGYVTWRALVAGQLGVPAYIGCFLLGLTIWTATEYFVHRNVFHWLPPGKIGARLHFIFHGVHHDYPNDALRLVLPPSVSIPLALAFYGLFSLIFAPPVLWGVFAGFIVGYICYDTLHYALHHFAFQHPLFKILKRNHMQHHFVGPNTGYGVTSPLWDWIMGTRGKPAGTKTA
ncbi:MAG: sterol desaturase family protein [Nevskia sp.]|nr:sterol desaturase family protein [Nevskia sp.]